MPYYKKRDFFLIALESILNQTFQNFEIVIVYDDLDVIDLDYILEKKKKIKESKLYKTIKI